MDPSDPGMLMPRAAEKKRGQSGLKNHDDYCPPLPHPNV